MSGDLRPSWRPDFLAPSPLFDPLRTAGEALRSLSDWPTHDFLNALIANWKPPINNADGQPIRFVAQDQRQQALEFRYEPRIYLRGEVQTRQANWHDLFNALVWMTFPRTKAVLNARQYAEALVVQRTQRENRTPVQDALTIFDEGGAIVLSCDSSLLGLLRRLAWKELFCARRAQVEQRMTVLLFGHALYEKALSPYPGMTAKCVVFEVEENFRARPYDDLLAHVDKMVASWFLAAGAGLRTAALSPLPILGIPGWTPDNQDPRYYDNKAYFRDRYGVSGTSDSR